MKRNMSYSLINSADCMKKLYYYMNRTAGRSGPAAERGTKIHKALETYHLEFVDPKLVPDEEPLNLSNKELKAFRVALEKYKELRDGIGFKFGPETKLEFEKAGMPVTGVFDLFLNDGTVYDWKFPNSPWNPYKLADYTNKQAWYYFWLLEEFQPQQMTFSVIDFETFTLEEFVVPVDWEVVKQKLTEWQNLADSIRSAEFMEHWPASPGPQKCGWCNYKKICEESQA